MSDSETSTDINIDIIDNKGKISNKSETKKSSDTDYYMNLLANQNKTVPEKQEISSDSEIVNSDSSSSKRTSSVKSSSSSSSSSRSRKSNSSRGKTEHYNLPSGNHHSPKVNDNSHYKSSGSSGSFSGSTSIPVQLTPQETRMKKIELLRKLAEIKAKGFSLTKEYDFNSSIEEMEYEFALLKSFVDKRNGVKIFKSGLLQAVSVIEFLNDKYDPFDFHLQGWGEHMSVEVDSYDDVLEELYEKYKGTGKGMPPEVKLLLLLTASAGAFHFSKTQSSIPGLEQTLSRNPELVSKLLNPQKPQSQFMSAQELNIQKQRALLQQREKELKQKQPNNVSFVNPPSIPIPRKTVSEQQVASEPQAANESRNKLSQSGVPEIRAPSNVQDILNRIKQSQANIGTTDTQDETSSNNDRIVSDVNVSESKKGRKPKSTPSIYISTK
jgi:hypothetical protein